MAQGPRYKCPTPSKPYGIFSNVCRGSCNKMPCTTEHSLLLTTKRQTNCAKFKPFCFLVEREHQSAPPLTNVGQRQINSQTISLLSVLSLISVLGYNVHYLTGNLLQKVCYSCSLMDIYTGHPCAHLTLNAYNEENQTITAKLSPLVPLPLQQ